MLPGARARSSVLLVALAAIACSEPAGSVDAGRDDAGASSDDAGGLDAGSIDAAPEDAASLDTDSLDADSFDAAPIDASALDAPAGDAAGDAGSIDASAHDPGDGGPTDAAPVAPDAGLADAGAPDGGRLDPCTPLPPGLTTWTRSDTASVGTPDSYVLDVTPGDPFCASITGGGGGSWTVNVSNGTSSGLYCSGAPTCSILVPAGQTALLVTAVTDDIGAYTLTVRYRPR